MNINHINKVELKHIKIEKRMEHQNVDIKNICSIQYHNYFYHI